MTTQIQEKLIKAHVFISGRVQGVFYRFYTEKQAKRLGVSGWVRNRLDSRVEAVIVGPEKKVNQMLSWFWQGSPLSKVEKVKTVTKKSVKNDPFAGQFTRRPTI